ncbi:MAG: PadR family transcriptional regulator [Acidimicrobiales bacterium]
MWGKERIKLTPTSYLILGLVGRVGPCTAYEMKAEVSAGIGHFWTFPHSQLYAEPARLAAAGLLAEEQEETGRRRRLYTLTSEGERRLQRWLADPPVELTEIRDMALLKLYFSGLTEPAQVQINAAAAAAVHRGQLDAYERVAKDVARRDPFGRATLELGLRYERAAVAFWEELSENPPGTRRRRKR